MPQIRPLCHYQFCWVNTICKPTWSTIITPSIGSIKLDPVPQNGGGQPTIVVKSPKCHDLDALRDTHKPPKGPKSQLHLSLD